MAQQQQLLVLDHGLFLLERQLLEQRLRIGHAPGEFGEVDLERAADRIDPRQRHVALGQHPLDAGFGHVQRPREVRVGHAGGLEFVLQGQDEVDGGAHGGTSIACRYRKGVEKCSVSIFDAPGAVDNLHSAAPPPHRSPPCVFLPSLTRRERGLLCVLRPARCWSRSPGRRCRRPDWAALPFADDRALARPAQCDGRAEQPAVRGDRRLGPALAALARPRARAGAGRRAAAAAVTSRRSTRWTAPGCSSPA